jgi:hypothetical protein
MDPLAEQQEREDALFDQLLAAPLVELTGIVAADGVGGGRSQGQETWSLIMSFDAWRIGDQPVRAEELTIRRRVSEEELTALQDQIEPDSIIRIKWRVAEDNIFGFIQGHLDELVGAVEDAELQALLTAAQQPRTFEDEQFGVFTFDRRMDQYEAAADWGGAAVELSLEAADETEAQQCLAVARQLWAEQTAWKKRIDDFAVAKLLPLKNGAWLDEDEVTPETFKSRMMLNAIAVESDGAFTFWHDDGDLFWGHSIQVWGDLESGPTDADIPG